MIASRWRLPEAPRPSRASSRGTAAFSCVPALSLALVFSDPGSVPALLTIELDPHRGEELYSPAADVDVEGLVDGTDLAILAAHFGDSI